MTFWPESIPFPLKPLKFVSSVNPEVLPETTDPNYEFEYVDIGSVTLERGIEARERQIFSEAPSRARKPIRPGDTIIATVRTYLKAIAFVDDPADNWVASTGFAVCRPNLDVDPKFLYRALQSDPFVEAVVAASTGVSYPAINPSTLGMLTIPVPDLPTQQAIAAFLDRETARIDQLIAKKEGLLALLDERRISKIHEEVGGRADESTSHMGTAPEWYPAIPSTWELKPLRQVAFFQRGHDLPAPDRIPGDVPLVTSGGVTDAHNMAAASGPGIVTGRYGAIGKFYFMDSDYWPLNTTLYTRKINGYPKFIWYLLQDIAHIFLLNASKSAVPGVDRNDLHGELVPVPPMLVQVKIAAELDRFIALHDKLASPVTESITRLRELRAALITAAVTGQLVPATWQHRDQTAHHLGNAETT